MKKKSTLLNAVTRSAALVWSLSPSALVLKIAVSLSSGVLSGLLAPANEYLFTEAEKSIGSGTANKIYLGVALVLCLGLLGNFIDLLGSYFGNKSTEAISIGINSDFMKRIGCVRPIEFEDSHFIERTEKIFHSSAFVPIVLMAWINIIINLGSYFVVMSVYLSSLDPILIIALIFTFIPSLIVNWLEPKLKEKHEDKSRKYEMLAQKYSEHAKNPYDTRLYGAYGYFAGLHYDNMRKKWDLQFRYDLKIKLISFGCGCVKIVGWVFILLLLLRSLKNGTITTGAFAAVFSAVEAMFAKFDSLFGYGYLSEALQYNYANTYFAFRDSCDESDESKTTPDFAREGVKVINVTFKYPESEEEVIKNVSINIKKGEVVAIVGENGSGKTTLSKLISGLYPPTSGKVIIGGADTKKTGMSSLTVKTSAVFQNFMKYKGLSLEKNVSISDSGSMRDVIPAFEKSGVNYNDKETYPAGSHTVMGRSFDGAEISGGQWQRVSIARGLYRVHDMIILDEPTSAIDALEETKIYKQFAELSRGKTAVLITHRLGSVKLADRILVMDRGEIVESGTQEELLRLNGKYMVMWNAQAAEYVED